MVLLQELEDLYCSSSGDALSAEICLKVTSLIVLQPEISVEGSNIAKEA